MYQSIYDMSSGLAVLYFSNLAIWSVLYTQHLLYFFSSCKRDLFSSCDSFHCWLDQPQTSSITLNVCPSLTERVMKLPRWCSWPSAGCSPLAIALFPKWKGVNNFCYVIRRCCLHRSLWAQSHNKFWKHTSTDQSVSHRGSDADRATNPKIQRDAMDQFLPAFMSAG